MKNRNLLTIISLGLSLLFVQAQESKKIYHVPTFGNSFEIGHDFKTTTVRKNAIYISPNTANKTSVYFKLLDKGEVHVILKGTSTQPGKIKIDFLGKTKELSYDAPTKEIDLGSFVVEKEGYQHLDITGLQGEIVISEVALTGSATESGVIYSNDPSYYYWAKRGPSCHLAYTIPTSSDVSYYYNEITVPRGEDVIGSYYMVNGFGEGYFGIQVNSPTERRVLFSVWSPFHTDDPKSIPDEEKIVLLKKGKDVYTGEFGNEGSGGQSFLRYNWKAGETYKFLLKGIPDGKGNTDYTAWFYATEKKEWLLIASFKRPKTNTYLKRFHSFLENFDPKQGYLSRKVLFGNQWVYDGEWKNIDQATLTVDATYAANQRVDATGGTTEDGYFFLKMGGFFDDIEKPRTRFKLDYLFDIKSKQPQIDFDKLP